MLFDLDSPDPWSQPGLGEVFRFLDRLSVHEEAERLNSEEYGRDFNVHENGEDIEDPVPVEAEWSVPMAKAEIARRVFGRQDARAREVNDLLDRWGLKQVSKNKWQVRLDCIDSSTRRRLEG